MQPQLFQSAVEQQLQRLKEEKEAKEAADQLHKSQEEESDAEAAPPQRSSSELVLRQRMEEVRALEVQATLEDLMYVSILEKFVVLGVEMLPRMDGESAGATQLQCPPLPLDNAQQPHTATGMSASQVPDMYCAGCCQQPPPLPPLPQATTVCGHPLLCAPPSHHSLPIINLQSLSCCP